MYWLNEPPEWHDEEGRITVLTGEKTDFWRKTHYGYINHSGHAYLRSVEDAFSAQVKFRAAYKDTYDQAGLMLYMDEAHWLKAGVEFVDGSYYLSVVATNEFSDWSTLKLTTPPVDAWIRLLRKEDSVTAEASIDGCDWQMLRLSYLKPSPKCGIGPMCCSPGGNGLSAIFEDFQINPIR